MLVARASEKVRAAALTHGGGYSIATPVTANVCSAASTQRGVLIVVPGYLLDGARFRNEWTTGAGAAVAVLPRPTSTLDQPRARELCLDLLRLNQTQQRVGSSPMQRSLEY